MKSIVLASSSVLDADLIPEGKGSGSAQNFLLLEPSIYLLTWMVRAPSYSHFYPLEYCWHLNANYSHFLLLFFSGIAQNGLQQIRQNPFLMSLLVRDVRLDPFQVNVFKLHEAKQCEWGMT